MIYEDNVNLRKCRKSFLKYFAFQVLTLRHFILGHNPPESVVFFRSMLFFIPHQPGSYI